MKPTESGVKGRCQRQYSCPSATCEEGAILLGIVGAEGVLGYLTPQMAVDAEFCREAREGTKPETRFRFAQPCVEDRCAQWVGSHCDLIHQVLNSPEGVRIMDASYGALPKCSIRTTCRWFAQAAGRACAVCPWIVHSPD